MKCSYCGQPLFNQQTKKLGPYYRIWYPAPDSYHAIICSPCILKWAVWERLANLDREVEEALKEAAQA